MDAQGNKPGESMNAGQESGKAHHDPTRPGRPLGEVRRPLAAASTRLRGRPGRPRKMAEPELSSDDSAAAASVRVKRGSAGGAVAPQAGAQERAPVVPCPPRLLDLADAGRYLGVSPWTIRDLEAAGTLKRVTIPIGSKELRKILFDRADLDALIDRWKVS